MNRKMLLFSFAVFFILIFLLSSFSFSSEKKVMQAKLLLTPEVRMKDILKLQLDIVNFRPKEYIEFVTDKEEVKKLKDLGYKIEIVYEDLVAFYRSRLDTTKDMGGYHTYEETGHFLDSMHNEYPDITTDTISIDTSWEGRSIWAFKISDNPDLDEDEAEMLYTGLHHAREPMSIEVLLYYITHLLENYGTDPEVTDIVDNTELWFVPILNPDGYEYNRETYPGGGGMWRKNRRDNSDGTFGVDPNRNYGYMWGYDDIGSSPYTNSEVYRGPEPFSEPENQAIRDFVLEHDFVACINYHSVAEMFLLPWGYTYAQPSDFLIDEFFGDSASFYTGYWAGPGWELLYPTNGEADDWHRGEQTLKTKVFAYTPELGRYTFWPPPELIDPVCQENLEANMFYARMAQRLKERSIRYVETDPNVSPLVVPLVQYTDTSFNVRIYNHDTSSYLNFNITDPDSSEELVFDLASIDDLLYSKGFLASTDPFASLTKVPSSFDQVSDWLSVSPKTGSISPNSYQDLTVTVDATALEGEYFGKDHYGSIVIATNNNRTPPYSDTSLINVNLMVFKEHYDQFAEIQSSKLFAGISNVTNVGKKSNPGLGYLDESIQYLYDGSLFLGYIPQPGDTIVHREMFNTFSMRATSHLVIDSTTDPKATFAFYTDSTEDGDLGIDGEVIAYLIPDSSEFFVFKYKIYNLSGNPIDSLYIGVAYDLDVYNSYNTSGVDEDLNLVWQKSYYEPERYAGLAFLSQDTLYGASVIKNSIYIYPQGDFLTGELYHLASTPGFHPYTFYRDITTVMTAKKTYLGMDDTVEVILALAVTRDGLDDLKNSIQKAGLSTGMFFKTGNVNDDGAINLGDVIYLANYLLKGGPAPVPDLYVGDVNCDDLVNLGDVIYLANFLLKGGPKPCIH